jgi:hypothetical protein
VRADPWGPFRPTARIWWDTLTVTAPHRLRIGGKGAHMSSQVVTYVVDGDTKVSFEIEPLADCQPSGAA